MNLINDIYKERLFNKSIKDRYKFNFFNQNVSITDLKNKDQISKVKYFLDKIYFHYYQKHDNKLITFKNTNNTVYIESYKDIPSVIFYYSKARAWHKNGKLHREGDLPAVIQHNGDLVWWFNGEQHRDDDKFGNPQPAIITHLGEKEYIKHGKKCFPYGYDKYYNSK